MRRSRVLGLAEMMNFPGVIAGDPAELEKLGLRGRSTWTVTRRASSARSSRRTSPPGSARTTRCSRSRRGASGSARACGCSSARPRWRATSTRCCRSSREYGPGRIAFCTDDRDPEDIADNGHVNGMVRDAVAAGVEPADAIVMASLHPAQWHRLHRHGAVAPGYVADLLLLPDLETFVPELVLKRGRPIEDVPRAEVPEWVRQTVRLGPTGVAELRDPVERRGGARDRPRHGPGRHGVARRGSRSSSTAMRSPTRSATSSSSRSSSGTSARGGSASRSSRARGCSAGRSRRPSRTTRTTSSSSARATRTWRSPSSGSPRWGAASSSSRAARWWPSARCRSRACSRISRSTSSIAQSRACNEAAIGLGWRGATPFLTLAFLALSVIPSLKLTDRGLVDVDRFAVRAARAPTRAEAGRRRARLASRAEPCSGAT